MTNYDYVEAVVRQSLGGVTWTHKIQEKQADIYSNEYKTMEIIRIIAASLTSAGILALFKEDSLWIKLVTAFLSFTTILIGTFFKSFDLQTMVNRHKKSATELLSFRDNFIALICKIKIESGTPEELLQMYEEQLKRLHKVYKEAPITSDKAVALANKALKVNKDNTFYDEEIDSFLPIALGKGETQR